MSSDDIWRIGSRGSEIDSRYRKPWAVKGVATVPRASGFSPIRVKSKMLRTEGKHKLRAIAAPAPFECRAFTEIRKEIAILIYKRFVMTMKLKLAPDVTVGPPAQAEESGVSLEDLPQKSSVKSRASIPPSQPFETNERPIWEVITDIVEAARKDKRR